MDSGLKIVRRFLMAILCIGSANTFAGKPPNLGDGEMAMIPAYCPDTMGFKYGDSTTNTSPRAKHWVGLMGPSFWHMHHYCWALLNMRRADAAGRTQQDRRALRDSAIGDIQYVVRNSPPSFVMLPEILATLGGVQIQAGDITGAYNSFQQARVLKPDYWPAYSDWADFLAKSGQKAAAKELLKTGLEQIPESRELMDRYRSLGGMPSDISPGKVVSDPAASASPATAASSAGVGVPVKQQ